MYFQDLDHIFSQYVPPSRQITCIYDIIRPSIHPFIQCEFVCFLFVCLFFFWKGEERERSYILFALCLPTCPSSPTPSPMPSPTPYPYEMMQGLNTYFIIAFPSIAEGPCYQMQVSIRWFYYLQFNFRIFAAEIILMNLSGLLLKDT